MPWKVSTVSEHRLVFVQLVVQLGMPVAQACRQFGISRKTGYKWLQRYRDDPDATLQDRSRRPQRCPHQTDAATEQRILTARDQFNWGARKIRAYLIHQGHTMPSIATVNQVLRRHQRIASTRTPLSPPTQRFERDRPNQLWQLDFKGPLEIARQRLHPLTVLDDHSRYLLRLTLRPDQTMAGVWELLWQTFGDVGLPDGILCDNAFATTFIVPRTVSWFDSCLLRLNIQPIHGRPYHPQTQGKVERLHGTFERELYPRVRRDCVEHFHDDAEHWRRLYNSVRPHEALGDQPPITRWRPSLRSRPDRLPEPRYPDEMARRKVSTVGDVRWQKYRILAGRGLVGQHVGIQETEAGLAVYYCHKRIRLIPHEALAPGRML